jgi:F1F0 ATPase subunit 2
MREFFPVLLALIAGIGLGLFYFGGLWLTVRRIPKSRNTVVLTLGSFFGRIAFVIASFYLVMGSHWERLIACLITFIWMRNLLLQRLQYSAIRSASKRGLTNAYKP